MVNTIYLWCVTGMATLVALNTVWRLYIDRHRLACEDLTDEDRAFAWRIVLFILFPLVNFLDMRATMQACQMAGGVIQSWSYGLLWYQIEPAGINSDLMTGLVYTSGAVVQLLLGLALLPALLFRPHPFLATLVGYSSAFVLGLALLADPVLSVIGFKEGRWTSIYSSLPENLSHLLLVMHIALIAAYFLVLRSERFRLWFVSLSRPCIAEKLSCAITSYKKAPRSHKAMCELGILYSKAGLRKSAQKQLKQLSRLAPDSIYTGLLEALLDYRQRNYKSASASFERLSDYPEVSSYLKAAMLAGAACSAFASKSLTQAVNLAERALEFDDRCILARMVKVDSFLNEGKKEAAGQEILQAVNRGLSLDLENQVPADVDKVLAEIDRMEESRAESRPRTKARS